MRRGAWCFTAPMDFLSRIKKEMTEGIVRALLADAGYRVIGLGVETVVREVECLTALEYAGLDLPKAVRAMPDLLVMDRMQTTKRLVEVKYRSAWSASIFDDVAEQVGLFGELVLVCVNASPPASLAAKGPSAHIRCCKVRQGPDGPEVLLEMYGEMRWLRRSEVPDHEGLWWGLVPIQRVFEQVREARDPKTLVKAVQSLQGILAS